MTTGRPSKYDPKFCGMLIEHMKNGGSFTTFAAVAGVCRDTLYEWENTYEEFSDAKKVGLPLAEKWWEEAAQAGMMGQLSRIKEKHYDKDGNVVKEVREPTNFNSTVWVFSMKNRFDMEIALD